MQSIFCFYFDCQPHKIKHFKLNTRTFCEIAVILIKFRNFIVYWAIHIATFDITI